jgi:hypothetical protein
MLNAIDEKCRAYPLSSDMPRAPQQDVYDIPAAVCSRDLGTQVRFPVGVFSVRNLKGGALFPDPLLTLRITNMDTRWDDNWHFAVWIDALELI